MFDDAMLTLANYADDKCCYPTSVWDTDAQRIIAQKNLNFLASGSLIESILGKQFGTENSQKS